MVDLLSLISNYKRYNTSGLSEKAPLYKVERRASPSRINLGDSNPVRGDMFIETGTTKHISSSVGAACEIAIRNTCRSYGACRLSWLPYAYKHITPNGVQDIDFQYFSLKLIREWIYKQDCRFFSIKDHRVYFRPRIE